MVRGHERYNLELETIDNINYLVHALTNQPYFSPITWKSPFPLQIVNLDSF